MAKKQYTVIDLFCGSGGFSLGFEWAGNGIYAPSNANDKKYENL